MSTELLGLSSSSAMHKCTCTCVVTGSCFQLHFLHSNLTVAPWGDAEQEDKVSFLRKSAFQQVGLTIRQKRPNFPKLEEFSLALFWL